MTSKSKTSLTPKLRFPEFKDAPGWSRRTLGDFLTERSAYPEKPVPLYSLTIEDGVTPKTERYERSFLVKDKKEAYKLMLPDDFAFNPMNLRFGAIGRHAGSEIVAVSKYYNIFTCDNSTDVTFCELYLKSNVMIAYYDNMAIGSLIEKRRVHFKDFLKFEISFPLLPEQQKIAACLGSLDDWIAAEGRKLAALRDHKQGLMQQLFPQPGQTQPRVRFPEFRDAPFWKVDSLGNVCDRIMDGTHFSPKSKSGPRPYLTSKNVRNGTLDLSTVTFISEEEHREIYKRCPVQLDDVLLTKDGASTGNCTINTLDYEFSLLSSVAVIRGNGELLNQHFLYQTITSDRTQQLIAGSISGQAITRITLTKLGKYPIAYPSLNEQQAIADCLSALDARIAAQAAKIDALQTHKRGLMQQLFPSPEGAA